MAYIVHDDYSLRIGASNLDEILQQAILGTGFTVDQVRVNAESWAMATIKGYLVSQYNIVAEFAKNNTDPTRNPQVVVAIVDIALYTLHKTINPRDVPQHVEDAYKSTLHWLIEARDARIIVDLPPPADQSVAGSQDMHFPETFLSSQSKFISKPYQDERLFDTELGAFGVQPSIFP